jgi:peptidoglycan/xylan/chitin deacetylase (PgdA/CDA1 family)
MQHVVSHRYPVLELDKACEQLGTGSLPDNAVVITVDDGFYSFFDRGWPVLRTHAFPATIDVASYYAAKQRPVFRLIVQYMSSS